MDIRFFFVTLQKILEHKIMEAHDTEYKSIWKDDYLISVCAFANTKGGTLFIGKNDDGTTIDISDPKAIKHKLGLTDADAKYYLDLIPKKIISLLGIVADVTLHRTATGNFIEITVEQYFNAISYLGEYYVRHGSSNQILKGATLSAFLLKKQGKHWDSVPVSNVKIEDLSLSALQRFRTEATRSGRVDGEVLNDSTEHLLHDLKLIDDATNNLKRAAVLLFHPDPEKFFIGAYVKIGFFRKDDDDLAFQDEIHGSLMEQIEKTYDLLKSKYITYAISYEGISRREKPTFPTDALRESLLNAIAHKDYTSGAPIQISVYPDRIIFWNSGRLPQSIPIETLFEKHPSVPYNPNIANALFRCGDIEAWGRGYRKIIKAVMKHKQLPPTIRDVGGLMLTYYADAHTQIKEETGDERIAQIVEYVIKKGSISNSEVQNVLKTSKPTATRLLKQASQWLIKQGERGLGTIYVTKWKEVADS